MILARDMREEGKKKKKRNLIDNLGILLTLHIISMPDSHDGSI